MSIDIERYIDLYNMINNEQTKSDISLNYLANIFGKIKVNQNEMNPNEYLDALCLQSDNEQIELTSSQNENVIVGFGHKKNAEGLDNNLFELSFDQSSSNLTLKPKFKSEEHGHFVQDEDASGVSVNIPIQELASPGASVELPMDDPGTIRINTGNAIQAIWTITFDKDTWEELPNPNGNNEVRFKTVSKFPVLLKLPPHEETYYITGMDDGNNSIKKQKYVNVYKEISPGFYEELQVIDEDNQRFQIGSSDDLTQKFLIEKEKDITKKLVVVIEKEGTN